ncbi:TonB-dependent receptor [Sphingosinicella sp. LHD-64]|uniref:TonB-dependent receptor n=1 Tax=Sphingosinicella sp. LHD-64 TaxID=3072139 RepID=UPI00280EC299|nr:TonB-dependent receptor [Sphingosinicella sp. LHD-64]MDQ8756229.1 TonB-dependent receptor [Sphingosinicella sp. LHD-64]
MAITIPASAQTVTRVDLAPQSLSNALNRFGRQAGIEIIFTPLIVRGLRIPAVRGAFTVEGGLDRLLTGTGLRYRRTAQGAYVIERHEPRVSPAVQTPPEALADEEQNAPIVVTGSRIRRPNLDSVVPVTTIDAEEFRQTGQTSVGDILNEFPALRTTVGQTNSSRLLGTPGLSQLDLRGLGVDRTLVLQNGRRHISGSPSGTAPDINTIPVDLIERVDIVTGGSSAIYGSDAIAGVVNFVLKRDYEGIQLRGHGGVSEHGDAGQLDVSLLAGTNFGDDRGNVAVNLQYTLQQDWYASQRRGYRTVRSFLPVDFDEPGLPNGSDGIPDQQFFEDIRYIGFSNGGQFLGPTPGADGYLPAFNFQPDGTLRPQTGERVSLPPVGFTIGGDGSTIQEGRQLGIYPRLERFSANLIAHFELSDAFEPFVEAKFVRTDSLGSSTGPFFTLGEFVPRAAVFTDNPYLNPQARQLIRSSLGLAEGEEASFFFGRNFLELGTRQEDARRDTHRVVVGARGDIDQDWSYEISANYADLASRARIIGNVNVQRYLLALDSVRDPSSGEIVCRARIDPAARIALEGATDPSYAQARLAQDVAACVPLNPFGEGNISDAAADYILEDTSTRFHITQFVANAFVSGDLGRWFELPGGPVGVALGAEYRRETFFSSQDPIVQAGLTFYNAQPGFDPPPFEVKELFGEIRLPLLARRRFAEELTITAAARLADYGGGTGTVLARNAGAQWTPTSGLRLRANFSRAVRAPNLVETFAPFGARFSALTDPCAVQNIGSGSANRVANCRADGVPEGFDLTYVGSSFQYRAGGNPDLEAERSDSLTVGAVVQPRFLPGLSLSADYYSITVDNVIATPQLQQLVDTCYDSSDTDNAFCGLFERFRGPGAGPNGERPGQILKDSLRLSPVNFAALKVRGIDIEASYRRSLPDIGSFRTRFTFTHVLQNDTFLDPTDPDRANQVLLELGDPQNAFNWDVQLQSGPVTFGYQLRYIGKMTPAGGSIENIRSVQGRPPENEDAFSIRFYPDVLYHDLRMSIEIGNRLNVYMGVDNLTDRLPPYGLNGINNAGGIYNNVGRFFYAGAVARF